MAQTQKHAGEVGSYQAVISLDSSVVNPGTTLNGRVFISGYGQIDEAKMFIVAPNSLGAGTMTSGFSHTGKGEFQQGMIEAEVPPLVFLQMTAKITGPKGYTSNFSDLRQNEGEGPIMSEIAAPNPPLSFSYNVPRGCPPGTYNFIAVFSYFNGASWESMKLEVPYTVRGLFQRHESLVAWLAAIAAVATIVGSVYAAVSYHSAPVLPPSASGQLSPFSGATSLTQLRELSGHLTDSISPGYGRPH